MYNVKIDDRANQDLNNILDYIFRFSFSIETTNKIYDEIISKIIWLKIFPNMYPVFVWDLRVMTIRNKYRIFYKVDEINKIVKVFYLFSSQEDYESLIH